MSLLRSSSRRRRHSMDESSLPAAFAVRRCKLQPFALACHEYDVRRTCTQAPHSCITYCTPSSGAGPLPVPKHARTHVPTLARPLNVVAHVPGPDRRLPGLWETMFGSISTCSSRTFQGYHPRVCQLPSWHPKFESGVQNHVRPPLLTATLCPDRGTAEPSCTPHVCRVQPKHPCITCRTHPAQAVPVPHPEHAHTHPPPCCPHVAGAHVSGPGWRLPGCYSSVYF